MDLRPKGKRRAVRSCVRWLAAVLLIALVLSPLGVMQASANGGGGRGRVTIDGNRIKLIDVKSRRQPVVEVRLNGTSYRVRVGDTFARRWQVDMIDTSERCAGFRYTAGTTMESFTLCL